MNRIPLERIRWRLGVIWFAGAGLLFSMLIIQSLANVYEDSTQKVWEWLLPNVMPTLSLMIGVFAASALGQTSAAGAMTVRRPFARLATALSIFHLLTVLATILAFPFVGTVFGSGTSAEKVFETSNLWLGPLQGLVAGVIGTVFSSQTPNEGGSNSG